MKADTRAGHERFLRKGVAGGWREHFSEADEAALMAAVRARQPRQPPAPIPHAHSAHLLSRLLNFSPLAGVTGGAQGLLLAATGAQALARGGCGRPGGGTWADGEAEGASRFLVACVRLQSGVWLCVCLRSLSESQRVELS